jgi:hypothetical protein
MYNGDEINNNNILQVDASRAGKGEVKVTKGDLRCYIINCRHPSP